jgi:hypothetical protein
MIKTNESKLNQIGKSTSTTKEIKKNWNWNLRTGKNYNSNKRRETKHKNIQR